MISIDLNKKKTDKQKYFCLLDKVILSGLEIQGTSFQSLLTTASKVIPMLGEEGGSKTFQIIM